MIFTDLFKFDKGIPVFEVGNRDRVLLDVIPYVATAKDEISGRAGVGELRLDRTFWVHFIDNTLSWCRCKSRLTGELSIADCKVCERRYSLAKDSKTDPLLIYDMRPIEMGVFNVIDLDEPISVVRIFIASYASFGFELDRKLYRAGMESNLMNFADPEIGTSLEIFFCDVHTFKQPSREEFNRKIVFNADFGEPFVKKINWRKRRKQYGDDIVKKAFDLDLLIETTASTW